MVLASASLILMYIQLFHKQKNASSLELALI